jgi:hypothetical protein
MSNFYFNMKHIMYLFAILLVGLTGCKNDTPPPPEPAPEPLPSLDTLEEITTPDPYFLKKYQGKIDGKLDIEMVLVNWGDGFISGRYW